MDQKMRSTGAARRKKVNARASALIAEEVTLQELRQARKVTQTNGQGSSATARMAFPIWKNVATFLLPTLRKSVEAMGGNLSLVAEFPDREPVVLSGIAEVEP